MKKNILVMLLTLSMMFGNVNVVLADTETEPIRIEAKVSSEPQLIWSDEFEGTELDTTKWECYEFNASYGSGASSLSYDLECYEIKDGKLVIKPQFQLNKSTQKVVSSSLKSAKIWTRGLYSFKYGKIEIRAKLPKGQGTAPMAWMLGEKDAWPLSGEMDILVPNQETKKQITQSIQCNKFNEMQISEGAKSKATIISDIDEYHTYGIIWDKEKITYAIDGVETWVYNPDIYSDSGDGNKNSDIWPFNQPFYFILNCGIGDILGGEVSTVNWTKIATNGDYETYQDQYYIDYVRVYDLEGYVKPKASVEKVSKFSAINKKGRKVKLSWKKVSLAEGYQITYALNKKFTKRKKHITTKKKKYTIKKLKRNKTYYFKVRAYKGKKKSRVYGAYSKVRKVKIKK